MRTTGSPVRSSLTALLALSAATVVVAAVSARSTSFGVPTTFGPGAFYALKPSVNGGASYLDVADLNGDGFTDVVIGDLSKPTQLQLLMNTGGGGLNPATYLPVAGANDTYRVLASDLDDDGDVDLVSANNQTSNLSVLHNAGGGVFLAPTNYPVAGGTRAAAVGDLNGDGVKDLVGGNTFSQVVVFMGKPANKGFFTSGVTYSDAGNNRQSVYIADVTGDGKNDVIAGNRDSSNISVFPGKGDGTLGTAFQIGSTTAAGTARGESLAIRDFNGDNLLDIAAPGDSLSEIVVYLNQGGTFGAGTSFPTGGTHSLYVDSADFNQDGHLDLVVSNVEVGRNFSILHGDGTGAFGPPTTFPNPLNLSLLNAGKELRVADFNKDGKPDVAIVALTSRVVIFLNDTFSGPTSCDPGKYLSGSMCVDAPAGSYSPGGTATSATLCPTGTYSSTSGSSSCTPAPAGSYVPDAGAISATACPAHYSSNAGATSCFALDTDNDGVMDKDDAYIDSNLSPTVGVGTCASGVRNAVLSNGASLNDLLAATVAGTANHGARQSVAAHLFKGWKAAGLITGRQEGELTSCVARSKF